MAKAVCKRFWKVPEPKSYEQVSLVKLTLPWLRFKCGPTINVWGGGGMWPGKPRGQVTGAERNISESI
jgi:hypothetical protein